MNAYDAGDIVRVTASFTNSAGAAVDPSSLQLQYQPPTNVTTALAYGDGNVIKSSSGLYYADLAVNSSGTWKYRWNGTGSNAAAAEGMFQVRYREVF
jgi:hypothetical protein